MTFRALTFAALVAVAYTGAPLGHSAPSAIVSYSIVPALSYAAPAVTSDASTPAIATYVVESTKATAAALSYDTGPAFTKVSTPITYAKAQPVVPTHYDFGYSVNDPHTGDSKSQEESRRGDLVLGTYSVIDPDGTKRTVNYAADPLNGFNAVVQKEPAAVPVKSVAPVTSYAAPSIAYIGGSKFHR